MANMVKCEQGHFFDSAVNRRCPHCSVPGLSVADGGPTRAFVGGSREHGVVGASAAGGASNASPLSRTPRTAGLAEGRGNRTIAWWDKDRTGLNPVVGWLVAIDGPAKGRDYRLHSEGNVIGRDPTANRVVIDDESVHRQKHAILYYDPRAVDGNAYHLQAGDGAMVYLNDRAVLQATPLNAYDVIMLGRTKLLFVPLCNERFRWEWE